MQTKINVGFIGAGKSTHRYQAPFILRRNDKFTIKTIWARNLDHIQWERISNVQYTDDLESMLNDDEIELIVVSTPVMHYEYALMALEHGKHVLVEKPFANTSEEAKEIFDLASQKGLMAMCIQNRRFDSDFLTTQKVIESGKLGDVYEVEMHYDYYRKDVVDATDHFDSYLSFLYGHACHTLDQALSYFGKPNDYHMEVKQIMGKGRMNDYFDIDFYYDNALKVTIASSYMRIKHRPRFVVYGTKGMFVKATEDRQEADLKRFYMPTPEHPDFGMDREENYGTITYYNEHQEYVEEKVPTVTGDYSRMYDAIYETIRNHKPQLVTPEQTLLQLKLLEEGIGQCE